MKTINYKHKVTSAGTQYVILGHDDQVYLQEYLLTIVNFIASISRPHSTPSNKEAYKIIIGLDRKIPYGRGGHNSIGTFIAGINSNWIFSNIQRELSEKQLEGIEYISRKLHNEGFGFDAISFHLVP